MRLLLTDGVVDVERAEVVRGERVVQLTRTERDLLGYLARHPGVDVPRDELHAEVWGHSAQVVSRAADYTVLRLRRKLEIVPEAPRHLVTASGGYRWVPATPAGGTAPTGEVTLIVAAHDDLHAVLQILADVVPVSLEPDRVVVAFSAGDRRVPTLAAALSGLGGTGIATGPAECLTDPGAGRVLYGGAVFASAVARARAAVRGTPLDADPPEQRSNLPFGEPRLVGRQVELAAACRIWDTDGDRIVLITGPPGCGKSRLGLEVLIHAPIPTRWISLCGARSVGAAVERMTEVLGIPDGPDAGGRIGPALGERGPLGLLLDGIEGLRGALDERIRGWLRDAPALRVVATSRERTALVGAVVTVGPLPADDAVRLLCDRCPELAPSDALYQLVERLDRLPLALALVAPRLRVLAPSELLARIDRQLDLSSGPERSMRAAIRASWDLLSVPEKHTLAQATVFPGRFSLAEAEGVVDPGDGWFVDVLQALVDKHVVERTEPQLVPGGRRFGLSNAVRAWVEEQLLTEPEWRGDAERRYVERLAASVRVEMIDGPSGVGLHDDLAHATQIALRHGWNALAARTAVGFAGASGEPVAGLVERYDLVVRAKQVCEDPLVRGRLWVFEAVLGNRLGRTDSLEVVTAAIAHAQSHDLPSVAGRAEIVNGSVLRRLGRPAEAIGALERAQRHAADVGDDRLRDLARIHLATTLLHLGEYARIRGVLDDPPVKGWNAGYASLLLGSTLTELGQLDDAVRHLDDAVRHFSVLPEGALWANARALRAMAWLARGDRTGGVAELRQVLVFYRRHGHPPLVLATMVRLAEASLDDGDPVGAASWLADAEWWAARTHDPRVSWTFAAARARERAAMGDVTGARRAMAEAEATATAGGERLAPILATVCRGWVELAAGEPERARACLEVGEAAIRELEVGPASPLGTAVRALRRASRAP